MFWARPPAKVRHLIDILQQKLRDAAPGIYRPPLELQAFDSLQRADLWLMPLENLHMTAMEVTHSLTVTEIDHFVGILLPSSQPIAHFPASHRARLIKPMLSYDSAALALSFVPANGESLTHSGIANEDRYTYHHLRRDLHTAISNAGVKVGSRYVVPSAHLTIARFNSPNVFGGDPMDASATLDVDKREHWIHEIDMINHWLENEYWPTEDNKWSIKAGGEWIVGEEKGLDFRKGTLWYGGGETVHLGKGFTRA